MMMEKTEILLYNLIEHFVISYDTFKQYLEEKTYLKLVNLDPQFYQNL